MNDYTKKEEALRKYFESILPLLTHEKNYLYFKVGNGDITRYSYEFSDGKIVKDHWNTRNEKNIKKGFKFMTRSYAFKRPIPFGATETPIEECEVERLVILRMIV